MGKRRKNGRPSKNPVQQLDPNPQDDVVRRDIRKAVKYTTEHLEDKKLQDFKAEQHLLCTRFLAILAAEAPGSPENK